MRSISSTDLDSTDPVSTPSRDQQATASPRKRGILVFSGVAIIAIAASGTYTFTAHSTAAAVKDVQAQLVAADSDFTAARESAQASIALAGEYGLESENVITLKSIYADSDATVTALADAPNNAKASNEKIESLKKVLDQAKTSTNKLNAALAPIAGELDDLTIKKLDEAANRANQALNDAKNLMSETDGKVKDNATRDGLQSTIDGTAKTIDEAREAVKNRSHVGDDRKWNVDEEKKLTDSVNALGEKSNQVVTHTPSGKLNRPHGPQLLHLTPAALARQEFPLPIRVQTVAALPHGRPVPLAVLRDAPLEKRTGLTPKN